MVVGCGVWVWGVGVGCGEQVLDQMGLKDTGLSVVENLLVLIGLWMGLAVVAYLLLERRSSRRERQRSKLLSS